MEWRERWAIEAQAHPSQGASEAPPSAFPRRLESAGRVRKFDRERGLARYEITLAEESALENYVESFTETNRNAACDGAAGHGNAFDLLIAGVAQIVQAQVGAQLAPFARGRFAGDG